MEPELKKRIQTAALGIAVIGLVLMGLGPMGALILSAVLGYFMLKEYTDATLHLQDKKEKQFVLFGVGCLIQFLQFWLHGAEFGLLWITFIGLFLYFLFTSPSHMNEAIPEHFREFAYSLLGLLYIPYSLTFLVSLRQIPNGLHWVVLFFLIVWGNDIGGYFGGKKFGKKLLFPAISPKKTWEGFYSGIGLSLVLACLYKLAFMPFLSWVGVIVITALVSPATVLGDLSESFFKRAFQKKDSGSTLPGHGGFLDRFDSVLLSVPWMFALAKVFG